MTKDNGQYANPSSSARSVDIGSLTNSAAQLEALCENAIEDKHAVGPLLDFSRPRLLRLIRLRMPVVLMSRIDPEDIVQETFVIAVKRFPEFAAARDVPVIVWLRQLAIERIIEATRKHVLAHKRAVSREMNVNQFIVDSNLAMTRDWEVSEKSPSEIVCDLDRAEDLQRALALLEDRDRNIIVLRFFEALTLSETAAAMSISISNAKVLQFRAVKKLESILETELGWKSADRQAKS